MLVDGDVLMKHYDYSPNSFVIVLTTPEQRNRDEIMAERRLRSAMQQQLQKRAAEIDSLLKMNKLSEEEYNKLHKEFIRSQETNEKHVREMVERYSTIDYDQLDESNRRITFFMENGEFAKADSMLRSKGDVARRVKEYMEHNKLNKSRRDELDKEQGDYAKSEQIARRNLEELANDCYSKHEIYRMSHENDSAVYYIKMRAALDEENVQWQLDAGGFLNKFVADYAAAFTYYDRSLKLVIDRYGRNHADFNGAIQTWKSD